MCLGGHLAFRCAFDKRIRAAVCYFATDIHSQTLGKGKNDDSIKRVKDISGELIMVRFVSSRLSPLPKLVKSPKTNPFPPNSQIFGKKDTHVPPEGRDLIRKTLHDAGVTFSFYEPAWAQHAFIRDELSKYVEISTNIRRTEN
jgi:carboxymethylenebutenolidase